jgi:serine-type D-Ala-D-Ala carboxypeptidase/endopeptidase
MGDLCEPNDDLLAEMVAPYLQAQPRGLGFAIGYASPSFANYGRVRVFGNVQNQFGADLCLSCETPFEIASITKTFTATLYAALIRALNPNKTIADYLRPGLPGDSDDEGADAVFQTI